MENILLMLKTEIIGKKIFFCNNMGRWFLTAIFISIPQSDKMVVCLFEAYLSMHLCIYLSIYLSIDLSIYLYLSIYPSIYLSICIYLSIWNTSLQVKVNLLSIFYHFFCLFYISCLLILSVSKHIYASFFIPAFT